MLKPTDPILIDPHPLADLFPLLPDDYFEELKSSIERRGFDPHFPVCTFQGKVLDGRHRQRACYELGIRPTYRVFEGDLEAAKDFVRAANLVRRDLLPGQRLAIQDAIKSYKHGGANRIDPGKTDKDASKSPTGLVAPKAKTIKQKAEAAKVGTTTVKRHNFVKQNGIPELFDLVNKGKIAIRAGEDIAHLPPLQQEDIVLTLGEPADPEIIQSRLAAHKRQAKELAEAKRRSQEEADHQAQLDAIEAQRIEAEQATRLAEEAMLAADRKAQMLADAQAREAMRTEADRYIQIITAAKDLSPKVPTQRDLLATPLEEHYWYLRMVAIVFSMLDADDTDDLVGLCDALEKAALSFKVNVPNPNALKTRKAVSL